MEKIPYKPGDVLVDKHGEETEVVDLSPNGKIVFIIYKSYGGGECITGVTYEQLDKGGFTLKTPKEEKKMFGSVWEMSAPDEECERCDKCGCERMGEIFIHPVKTSTPWRPEIGEKYFYIDSFRCVESALKSDWGVAKDYDEEFRYKSGNCFRTEEEAGAKLTEIMGREI